MTTRIMRRLLSIVLSVVMVVSLLPMTAIPVAAAELALPAGFGLTAVTADTGTWTVEKESPLAIKGYVTGSGSCGSTGKAGETNIVLTNTSGMPKVLSFTYAFTAKNDGLFKIDGTTILERNEGKENEASATDTYTKTLAAGDSIQFYLKSGADKKSNETLNLTNITLTDPPPSNVTFLAPVGGTVTADGSGVTADTIIGKNTIPVEAVAASGYEFVAWMDVETNEVLSTTANTSITFAKDTKVRAVFSLKTNGEAWFLTANNRMFNDLALACDVAASVANKTIVLMNSGTLSGSYTIPEGVTLLLPYSSEHVFRGTPEQWSMVDWTLDSNRGFPDPPEVNIVSAKIYTTVSNTEYRRLTMASGAKIVVNGTLEVSGQTHPLAAGQLGAYAQLQMESDTEIVVGSTGKLYAWGYIRGSGTVTVESKGEVYEHFDCIDYPPGGAGGLDAHNTNKVFGMTNYSFNNIEVSTTYKAGAKLKVYLVMTGYSIGTNAFIREFIGSDKNAVFNLNSGTITKTYTGGRQKFDIAGNCELNGLYIKINAMITTYTVDSSATSGLPLSQNWDMTVKNGANVTVNGSVLMYAGSTFEVENGAKVVIPSNVKVTILDAASDPSGVANNAVLDINGTIQVDGGFYSSYTDTSVPVLKSTEGTGVVDVNNVGTETSINVRAAGDTTAPVNIAPAKLQNADGSYTDANAQNMYVYANGSWAPCNHEGYVVTDAAKAPTCTETGLTEGSHCSRCDAIIVAQTTVDALGHTDADGDGNHTCDRDGCSEVVGECADPDKDHACNECGGKVGEHADTNNDHNCEYGCSEKIGEHADTNNDHNCEYGCSEKIGEHADTNNDHNCEYGCAEKIGTCEDADKDHKCDYGCDQTYGTCEDTNKDHTCDYGCTDAFFGVHEDTNLDHKCEYGCAVAIGVHADADKNHACDYGCAETIGTCEDADKDHACDHGCGQTYGDCKDTDYDHKCDYGCDKSYGVHADTEGDGDHLCNYCKAEMSEHVASEVKIENDVPSTCTVKGGYDEVIYCTECEEELSRKHFEYDLIPTVATINDAPYASLPEAVAAANDNDVIVMQLDAALTERLTISKNITLDLNGKSITADFMDDYGAIYVGVTGTLTITGEGTITNEQDVVIGNYGKVNIQGGTIVSNASNDGEYELNAALYNMYFSESIYGTATITGGTLSSEVWNSGVLTVDGGVLNGLDNSGKTTITAGTINGVIEAGDGSDAEGLEGHGTIAISGGQFESTIENAWCAAGYGPNLEPVEGYFGVHVHQYEIKVTDPTCTADGYTTYTCTTCGDAYEANVVPMLGHTFRDEDFVHVDATFGVNEHDEAYCANGCGEIQIRNEEANTQWVVMLNDDETVGYTTVQAALAAAQAGDTVKMMANSNESNNFLVIFTKATLDLNGFELTAAGLTAIKGNHIVDNSADVTGKLIVPKDNLSLQLDNEELPFWTDGFYVFLKPNMTRQRLAAEGANQFTLRFQPLFQDGLNDRNSDLLNGAADNGIEMYMQLRWEVGGYEYDYTVHVPETLIKDVYLGETVNAVRVTISGVEGFNLTINVVLKSDSGVLFKGADAIYPVAAAAENVG